MLEALLLARATLDPRLKAMLPRIEAAVADGQLSPSVAVEEIAGTLGL
jgi:LAO/AO transport system kinase